MAMASSILPTISTNTYLVHTFTVGVQQHKMKPNEINLTIAELCGWRVVSSLEDGLYWLETLSGSTNGYKQGISEDHAWAVCCPNYHASLDACAQFEGTLTGDKCNYLEVLCEVTGASPRDRVFLCNEVVCSTAPQRCEAFLRMHGKWIDNE